MTTYSCLREVAGSNFAALLAGQIPKNKPTSRENVIEPIIALNGIAKGQSKSEANRKRNFNRQF